MTVYVCELRSCTVLAFLVLDWYVHTMYINAKAMPINNIDYSHDVKAVEVVLPTILGPYASCYITPLVINSLGVGTNTHTNLPN